MNSNYWFSIAELTIKLIFKEDGLNNLSLLPSFSPFEIAEPSKEDNLFELTIDDKTAPIAKSERVRIKTIDTGNGNIIVDQTNDGRHQFIIKDINGNSCCLLIANKEFSVCHCALNGNYDMRSFGLNNAIMIAYAFASCKYNTLLIHASLVRQNGYGYAFIAKSGTGKSTQVSMWLKHLPNCDLMNDDNPIIRIIDNVPVIYGSPWSGKTPCYRNIKAHLGAITQIDRAPQNSIDRLSPIDALVNFIPACSSIRWDENIYDDIIRNITQVIEKTPFYILHCLPNKEAAVICNKTISRT